MHKMEYFSIFLPNNIIKIVSPAAKDDEPDQETDILWAKRSIVVDDQAAWLIDVQFERFALKVEYFQPVLQLFVRESERKQTKPSSWEKISFI